MRNRSCDIRQGICVGSRDGVRGICSRDVRRGIGVRSWDVGLGIDDGRLDCGRVIGVVSWVVEQVVG